MVNPEKIDFPVSKARQILEPGPVVLLSSGRGQKTNIMTLGWHCIMEFSPSLWGCVISYSNYSFDLVRQTGECVVNVPTTLLTDAVVGVGNSSGRDLDKFKAFGLTPVTAEVVGAPLVDQCYANFECKLYDDALVDKYNYFIFEIVKAHVQRLPAYPETLHYTGDGVFMRPGGTINERKNFTKGV